MNFREKCRSEFPEAAAMKLRHNRKIDNLIINVGEPDKKTGVFMTVEPIMVKDNPEIVMNQLVENIVPKLVSHLFEINESDLECLLPCLKSDRTTVLNILSQTKDFDLVLNVWTFEEGLYGLNLQVEGESFESKLESGSE